ncbi:multicomponent Na+:H+ antiporter subunit E [Methanocalculus alkaliphilus]|uniref:Na+/H+ antiporter subunit E n=1 Tax=Methanocalculus alkaliphilus TaxID=768730 RepID=UPI00209CFD03|nr:Na+/H+ antiporter subunit E [Methanocalculus alkaliphilus]MCP1714377.1 multicomponent Na+:H+ antiporter subunit E [Methanocalculus alkaliphilus]
MIFWLILSGYLDLFHITAGIICCGIVTLISGDLLFRSDVKMAASARKFLRFILYIPRLMVAILYANIDVAYRILHPAMPIDPGFITVETPFTGDVTRTTFANSLTLTPGTVTIDVTGGTFLVHAIVRDVSEKELLEERDIQKNLARIFGEGS